MTPQDQEKLFKLVRKRFNWSVKQASGYVHGVVDGYKRSEPRRVYVRGVRKVRSAKIYAYGYISGFIDAFGADALFSEWYKGLGVSFVVSHRWWEHDKPTAT